MTKLPVISGRDAVKAFGKLGYAFDRSAEVTSFFVRRRLRIAA